MATTASAKSGHTQRTINGLDAQQRMDRRQDLILDAALELFTSRGYENTSIELICQTAYVSTKSFYGVFGNKEECFLSLYSRTAEKYRNRAAEVLAHMSADEETGTRELIGAFVAMLAEDPTQAQITFGRARINTEAAERARRENRRWTGAFVESVWRYYGITGDRHRIAVAVVGGIFDVIADWLLDVDAADTAAVDALVDDLAEFYFAVRRGLR